MVLRFPRLTRTLFGIVASISIATLPCAAWASSYERELNVPEPAEVCPSCHPFKPGEPDLLPSRPARI